METITEDVLDRVSQEARLLNCLFPEERGSNWKKIRINTEKFVNENGFRPIVEIASFGNLTMRKARAAFAYDFIGVSAFEIEDEKSYNSAIEAAERNSFFFIKRCRDL